MNYATQQLTKEYINAITADCNEASELCNSMADDNNCAQGCSNCSARGATQNFWVHLDRVGKVLTNADGGESCCFADSTGIYTSNPSYRTEGRKVFRIRADDRGNLSYREV